MRINWDRFIAFNLPVVMRQRKIFNFLRELLSGVVDLHDRGQKWRESALQRASYNSSAIMLERMLRDQMGVVAEIQPAVSPYDFKVVIIKQGETYDDARLRALIDKYKQADKSYYVENGAVDYTVAFSDYVCEELSDVFTAEWTQYRCEQVYVNLINTISLVIDKTEYNETIVYAISEYPVSSPIVVTLISAQELYFEVGANRSNSYYPQDSDLIDKWTIERITPEQDEDYHYQPGTVIQWRIQTTDTSAHSLL